LEDDVSPIVATKKFGNDECFNEITVMPKSDAALSAVAGSSIETTDIGCPIILSKWV
jgi:hypothetical protein